MTTRMKRLWFNAFLWNAALLVFILFLASLPTACLAAEEPLAVRQMVLQEAEGEPMDGKIAVAAVAFDRMADPRWPDTLIGVIYQPYQFTGMWERRRDWSREQIEHARLAVWAARVGVRPCGAGVFWYHATSIEKPASWPAMEVRCILGGHVFYGDEK